MKSAPLGIQTSCENCSFAICKNDEQIGCKAGRLEKFKDLGVVQDDKENNFYKINRFCNMFRSEDQSLEDARKQIKLKFAIVIFDEDEKFCNIAINSCKEINYDISKFKIVLASKHNQRFGRLFSTIHEFKSLNINSELVLSLNKDEENSIIEKDIFQKTFGCTHLIKMKSTDFINPNFLSYIDESINDKLEAIVTYEMGNITCVQFSIVNSTYLDYHNYDDTVNAIKQKSIESSMYKKYEE